MRLAEYTDYSLRVLMYCAARQGELVTIGELAERHGLSKSHLMKIVNDLARRGVLETTRGRGGGLRLSVDPASIRIGDIVRDSETDFRLVECFDAGSNTCTLTPSCRLKHLFDAALQAYFKELDGATLADIVFPVPVAGAGGEGLGHVLPEFVPMSGPGTSVRPAKGGPAGGLNAGVRPEA